MHRAICGPSDGRLPKEGLWFVTSLRYSLKKNSESQFKAVWVLNNLVKFQCWDYFRFHLMLNSAPLPPKGGGAEQRTAAPQNQFHSLVQAVRE
jgi:hypothetical protein